MILVGHMHQEATHINYSGISLVYEMIIICSAISQFLFYKEWFSVVGMAIVMIKKKCFTVIVHCLMTLPLLILLFR